jgi:hypothetical protein
MPCVLDLLPHRRAAQDACCRSAQQPRTHEHIAIPIHTPSALPPVPDVDTKATTGDRRATDVVDHRLDAARHRAAELVGPGSAEE